MSRRFPFLLSSRCARKTAALGLVGALALPLIAWSDAVVVEVDGEAHRVRTYVDTVGEVLDLLEIDVGPADEVVPAPDTALADGLEIEVERAIAVDVVVDDEVHVVLAPLESVAEALAAADLGDADEQGAVIEPAPAAPVEDGDVVHVRLPKPVQVAVDGDTHTTDTVVETVADVLAQLDIELAVGDRVHPARWAPIDGPTEIVVERVERLETVVEVVVEAGEQRREDPELLEGKTRVAQEPQDGLRIDRYLVVTVDGATERLELIEHEIAREPVDGVVLVGTKQPPPPPPPPPSPKPKVKAAPSTPTGVWDRLARCEAGGNWRHNGRYDGGLQFHPDTWSRNKPAGYPTYAYEASREQQIEVGKRVQRAQGWAAWPACSRKLGLR